MRQDQRRVLVHALWGSIFAGLLAACGAAVHLSQPPNLYLGGKNYPDGQVPLALQTGAPPVFYVIDRMPVSQDGQVAYGTERSDDMAFGQAAVRFGAIDWADLVARTHVERGGKIPKLEVEGWAKLVRFPAIPRAATRKDGGLRLASEGAGTHAAGTQAFQAAIRAEIKRTGNARVLVYSHGAGNGFDNALLTLGNLCHFTGR